MANVGPGRQEHAGLGRRSVGGHAAVVIEAASQLRIAPRCACPGDGAGWYKGMSVYALDPEQVLEMTNSMLNPYVADITADEQNILVP